MEKNMRNRYANEEFAELVKIAESSEDESTVILLKYLLNPEIFEVFDNMNASSVDYSLLTSAVLESKSEKAVGVLVSLYIEEEITEELLEILYGVVEAKISSNDNLSGVGENIKKAISIAYTGEGKIYEGE